MSTALLVAGGLFILVYGPLALLAWRRRLLARLALRESVRRPGQLVLLICGLLIGSAVITASLVGADSTRESRLLSAYRGWGAVDLTVSSGGRFFSSDMAERLAGDRELAPYVDGVQAGVDLFGSVSDLNRQHSEGDVTLVGFDPTTQRPFGAFTLQGGRTTYGEDLGVGDVLVSAQLAAALEAHVGDRVRITAGFPGDHNDLHLAGIAESRGGGYTNHFVVFMPLKTAQLITANDGINVVRVSARGDQPTGLEAANRAVAPLGDAVRRLGSTTPLVIVQVKRVEVERYETASQFITAELITLSGLIVAAGAALVISLMLALAEERRPRLAILRALGLSRRGLVVLSVLEGAVYSLVAAAAGAVVGIFAGRLVGQQLSEPYGFDYVFLLKPSTLATAFAAGSLITLATVAAAAYRTSRMSVAAAIRDLPEPASGPGRTWPRRLATMLLVVCGGGAIFYPDPLAHLGGGVALIVAGGSLARGRIDDRGRATIMGLLLAVWAGIVVGGITPVDDMTRFMTVFVLGTLVAVFGLCIVAAANLRLLEAALALLGGRFGTLQAALWPPVAQLSRRPLPTGLATGTFALALVLVTLIAVFVHGYQPDYARDSAGYDIRLVSAGLEPIQLPEDVQAQVAQRVDIPMRAYVGKFHSPLYGPDGDMISVRFYQFSPDLLAKGPIHLVGRDKEFASNEAVWQAMARDPSLVVINYSPPGGAATLQGKQGPLRLKIVGNQAAPILEGVVASQALLAQIETWPAGTTVLLKTKPGVDPARLSWQIERALFASGIQATTIAKLLDRGYSDSLAWITFFDVILRMGLLVGVLSLAVVGIRAAVERRRAIGIMRSLGYQRPRLLAGLVAEAALTATIGVVTGIVAGAFLGYLMIGLYQAGSTFGIDGARLGIALIIVYGTALLITAALAWRAAQMNPAEAIRHTG